MSFSAAGRLASRHRLVITLVSLALCAIAVAVNIAAGSQLSSSGFAPRGTESMRALDMARQRVGSGVGDVVVVLRSESLPVTDPAFEQNVKQALGSVPEGIVTGSITPWSLSQPGLVSDDRRAVAAILTLAGGNDDERQRNFTRLRETLQHPHLQMSYSGPAAVIDDLVNRSRDNLLLAELVALPLMAILLVLIFRNLLAAVLPVLVGGLAVLTTFAVLRLLGPMTEISVLALNAVSVLTLAISVDAGLVVVSRFREELAQKSSTAKAVEATVATAGRAVCLSTLTIAVVSVGMMFSGIGLITSIGLGMAIAQAIGSILSVTLLPALLALLGKRVGLATAGGRRRFLAVTEPGTGWIKLANAVIARPVSYFVISVSTLAILSAPLLHAHLNFPDRNTLPAYAPVNVAASNLHQGFRLAHDDLTLVVTTFGQKLDTPQGTRDLTEWRYRLATVPNISNVMVAATSDTTAVLYVSNLRHPLEAHQEGAKELVRHIRQLPPPDGAKILVGGQAATALDAMHLLAERMPLMAGYTMAIILLALAFALRSLVLPIKAALMALISTGTAIGAVVWAFQDGHLQALLGQPPSPYVEVINATVMVMILAGLSIDYTFVLLSRIREQYLQTGSPDLAIAQGLQRSGRVVTAAALTVVVVAAVFFAFSEIASLRQLCLGLLVAVVIDVTIVRMLLLPASMKLLGRANWWWPWPAAVAVPERRATTAAPHQPISQVREPA